ncbi:MAG: V-type ATP synthase subunit E [Mariniphaga sp.]|nr:V-type ATP synthase subunit E [Mariniphaga sp.]
MSSKIQQLTETIYNEGIQKAREEAEALLAEARKKAAAIEKDAQKEAEKRIAETEKKAQELKKQMDSEIRMILNQAISALKQEITSVITMKVIQPSVKELFSDQDFLKKLISDVVKGWIEKESYDMAIILPERDREQMVSFFKNNLAEELNQGLHITFSKRMKSGFKVGPSDESYLISFTDEDFFNFLKGYLRPKTSHLLFEEK